MTPKPTKLRPVKPNVNKAVIDMLNEMMEKALSGEIQGLTAFMSCTGSEVWDGSAGEMSLSELILAFENMKFKQLFTQNVTEINNG